MTFPLHPQHHLHDCLLIASSPLQVLEQLSLEHSVVLHFMKVMNSSLRAHSKPRKFAVSNNTVPSAEAHFHAPAAHSISLISALMTFIAVMSFSLITPATPLKFLMGRLNWPSARALMERRSRQFAMVVATPCILELHAGQHRFDFLAQITATCAFVLPVLCLSSPATDFYCAALAMTSPLRADQFSMSNQLHALHGQHQQARCLPSLNTMDG